MVSATQKLELNHELVDGFVVLRTSHGGRYDEIRIKPADAIDLALNMIGVANPNNPPVRMQVTTNGSVAGLLPFGNEVLNAPDAIFSMNLLSALIISQLTLTGALHPSLPGSAFEDAVTFTRLLLEQFPAEAREHVEKTITAFQAGRNQQ